MSVTPKHKAVCQPKFVMNQAVARAGDTKARSRLSGRASGWMEAVRGQDDRKRERHARDGVWLPAGGGNPGARGLPDSRPKHGPGIAKGEAFSPLARPRQAAGWQMAPADSGLNGPSSIERRAAMLDVPMPLGRWAA